MTSIVLDVRDVHARYGKQEVLRGVTLQVRTGQWFCLLGPNGVGKSTLLHCVAARLVPSAGDILVCDHSVRTSTVDAKRKLGYGCAPEQLPGLLTGRQCLEVYASAKELECVDPAGCVEVTLRAARSRMFPESGLSVTAVEREYRLLVSRETHAPLHLVDRQWRRGDRPAESTYDYDFTTPVEPIELPERNGGGKTN